MRSNRSCLTLVALFAGIILFAESAFATHFRYGNIFWERDLTYVGAPGMVRVKVTIEAGLRWTYPGYPTTTALGHFNPSRAASGPVACAGVVPTPADANVQSCPPLGLMFGLNGSYSGVVGVEMPLGGAVTVTDIYGNVLSTSHAAPPVTGSPPTGFLLNPIVSQIIPTQDTMYARQVVYLVFPMSAQVRLTWQNGARISQLLDGNNDQPWRISTLVDLYGGAITKSPQASSSAIITVFTGQNNVITLPGQSFDNLTNQWRVATTAESLLPNPVPAAPSVFTINSQSGVINFTPRTTGFYGAQLILTSYDFNGIARVSVPIDLIFQAVAPSAVYSAALTTGDGQTTYTATVGQPFSYTMRSTLTPANAGYTGTINNPVLPPGASTSQPACTGAAPCVKTFNWTPTASSSPAIVCYTSVYTSGQTLIAQSPQQLCVTVNIAAQATTMTTSAASGVAGGGPLVLSATLRRTFDSAPLAGRIVDFSFPSDPTNPPWTGTASALTNSSGVATVTVTPTRTVMPPAQFTASFAAIAGELLASSSTSSLAITGAATALTASGVPATTHVGNTLTVAATLTRVTAPAGPLGARTVQFVLTGPSGSTVSNSAVTNMNGEAAVTFPAPTERGSYSLTATFAGDGNHEPSSVSNTINVYQKTQMATAPVAATAGTPTAVSATLTAVPSGMPLSGQLIAFSFGGAVADTTAVTDAAGLASTMVAFPNAGTVAMTASFLNAPSFFADHTGAFPVVAETATATVTVTSIQTALSAITAPGNALVGNPLSVSTTLSRTTVPAGPLSNQLVSFTLTAPGGASSSLSGTTDAQGLATVMFPALTARGGYTVSASYAGTTALVASTAAAASVTAYQRTALTLASASGAAGSALTVTATLLSALDGSALGGQSVDFAFGGVIAPQTATTDAAGQASVSVSFPSTGSFPVTASFFNAAGFYADTTGAFPIVAEADTTSISVTAAQTTLSAIAAPSTSLVGDSFVASTTLVRSSAPAGPVVGEPVTFTLTAPGGATTQGLATTNGQGVASATFSPTARGAHTINASFGANSSLAASTSAAVTVPVYQQTKLVLSPVLNAIATTSTTLSATLVALPSNTPIAGKAVQFSTSVSGVGPTTTATDNDGVASTTFVFAAAQAVSVTASFDGTADYYANSAGQLAPEVDATTGAGIVVQSVPATLAPLSVASTVLAGSSVAVSTKLTGYGGTAIGGHTVAFTITDPSGAISTLSATTQSDGTASVNVSAALRGVYAVSASFAGSPALTATSTPSVSVTAYQRTALTLASATGTAGSALTLTATLVASPGGMALAGQTVDFSFGGAAPDMSAVTDAAGVATITFTATQPGSFTAVVSFFNNAGFYTDHTGSLPAVPESASSTLTIVSAATSLAVTAPAATLAGASYTASATLIRNDALPVGAGQAVDFTVTAPGGATSQVSATTNAAGVATVTLNPAARGVHSVSAAFNGAVGLNPSSANAVDFTVYQRTSLAMAPVSGSATKPVTISATLTDLPGASALGGQVLTFSFSGPGAPAAQSATTDASGVASITVTFPSVATYAATASFADAAAFYTNSTGAIPPAAEVTTTSIEVRNNAPTFTAPADVIQEAAGAGGRTVAFTASGTDIEDGPLAAVCAPASGSTFPIGATAVSCTVTDAANAAATASFTVTIEDTTGPALTLPVVTPLNLASAAGRVMTFAASAVDIVDGAGTVACVPASGSVFPIGTTAVTCSSTDAHGNTTTGQFDVTVLNSAPTFAPPASITQEAVGADGGVVTFAAAGNDVEDGLLTAVCSPATGATFPIGATTVSCTVTDVALATATATFTVTITDTTAPALTLPAVTPLYATGSAGRIMNYTVTATDIVDGNRTVTCSKASGSTFPIGTTTVSCSSVDTRGNSSTGTFAVTVLNNAPTFTPPANITVNATGSNGAVVTFVAVGQDVENGARTAVCAPASGATFPIATTTVNCTVTDTAGATATGSFTVTVKEVTTPGEMRGDGFVRDNNAKYMFEFRARESARGDERASIKIRIDEDGRNWRRGWKKRDDRFESRTVDFIAFSDDPTIRPGRPRRAQIDTVLFSGIGEWNGQRNYRYEAFAQDAGEPGRHRETIRVKIFSPAGALVAEFEGDLDGGNIQSSRIRH